MSQIEHPTEGCEAALRLQHRVLDGERLADAERERLDHHVEACSVCRTAAGEMSAIQRVLRDLPSDRLPEPFLEEIWSKTSRAPARFAAWRNWGLDWRAAAAVAAMVVVALLGVWQVQQPRQPTDEEVAQAAAEARMVFTLTANALRRTETATMQNVLAAEVSPALQRVPIRWPGETRSGNDGP